MKKLAIVVFLFLLIFPLYSQNYTLVDVSRSLGLTLRWDPMLRMGMLSSEDTNVVFRSDSPWIVVNGQQLKSAGTISYEQGQVYLSNDAVRSLNEIFKGDEIPDNSYRVSVIMIDPGHGGEDSGAVSRYTIDGISVSLKEKFINLDVALRLQQMLKEQYPDKIILMTRTNDTYLTLEQRVALANEFELNPHERMLFISVHTNASLNRKGKGIETWYLPQDYRRQILTGEDGSANDDVLKVLNTLWEEEFTLESLRLAQNLQDGMMEVAEGYTPDRGIKEESWFVVTNKKMASALVELGFLTNAEDAELLRDTDYLASLAGGVFNGIVEFIAYFER